MWHVPPVFSQFNPKGTGLFGPEKARGEGGSTHFWKI